MKRRNRAGVVALAAIAMLALGGLASAAYTTPKLTVSYAGATTRIVASSAVGDDATAQAAIYVPTGTTVTTTAAPGTKVGSVAAQVSALALGGALLPLAGDIVVASPGAVPAASQQGCIQTATPSATLLLVLQAAGQTLNVPAYLIATSGAEAALGPAKLVFCLPPPDVPADKGGATFGAKFLSADMSLNGVFGSVASGAWIAVWTPYNAGIGTPNLAGTVASPAEIAPGAVTLAGKKVKGKRVLSGKLTQGRQGFVSRVQVWAKTGKTAFKPLKSVTTSAAGAFSFTVSKTSKATSFQARAVTAGGAAPAVCSSFTGLPAPCVNPTISGFTASSKTVALK